MRYAPRLPQLRRTLRLAVPVVTVQVGMHTMGIVDTVMAGHLSGATLAAVALGNLYTFGIASFGMGTLMGLDPLASQAHGAGDPRGVALTLQRGLLLALLITLPTVAAFAPAGVLLELLDQPPEIIPVVEGYAWASIAGILPFLWFTVLRQVLTAVHRVWPIVVAIVAANLLNVLLNWMLIFGELGAPRMGAVGSGWATSGSRLAMLIGLLVFAWRDLEPSLFPVLDEIRDRVALWRIFRLGAPVGFNVMLEIGAFGTIGLLMGWLGVIELAAHQVVLSLAALTFMVPLGISSSAGVLVGNAIGRGETAEARRFAGAGMLLGVSFMTLSACVFISVPDLLARGFSSDAGVIALATTLVPIAGLFQVVDGMQVVAAGILRGAADTFVPMIMNLAGFWLLGLPLSLFLAFGADLGAVGLWWGLAGALGIVAVAQVGRMLWKLRADVDRVAT